MGKVRKFIIAFCSVSAAATAFLYKKIKEISSDDELIVFTPLFDEWKELVPVFEPSNMIMGILKCGLVISTGCAFRCIKLSNDCERLVDELESNMSRDLDDLINEDKPTANVVISGHVACTNPILHETGGLCAIVQQRDIEYFRRLDFKRKGKKKILNSKAFQISSEWKDGSSLIPSTFAEANWNVIFRSGCVRVVGAEGASDFILPPERIPTIVEPNHAPIYGASAPESMFDEFEQGRIRETSDGVQLFKDTSRF